MKITYDKEADAAYIYLKNGKWADNFVVGENFIIDVDKDKNILGLEILNASKQLGNLRRKPLITIGRKSVRLPALVS